MAKAGVTFSASEQRFLREARVGRIATIDYEDGSPHCVAVDFLFHQVRLYFGSSHEKRKVRNLLADDRVAFEVDAYRDLPDGGLDWRGVMVKGRASLVEDPAERAEVLRRILQKCPTDTHDMETAIVAVRPRQKLRWGPWERFDEPA